MRAKLAGLLVLALLTVPTTATAAPKPGATCAKNSKPVVTATARFTCVKAGTKFVWKRQARPQPAPKPTPTPTPTPTETASTSEGFVYEKYTGGAGPGGASGVKDSIATPNGLTSPGSNNVRFWVYDPEQPTRALGSSGIFYQPPKGQWTFLPMNPDGTFHGTWAAGTYAVDTVEPNGNLTKYERRRYTVDVAADGTVTIDGLKPNAAGYFTLTINLRPVANNDFTPSNVCQLKGQDGNPNMNVGFPRRADRVPANGTVRAAFIPVAFPEIPGNGDPLVLFRSMAEGMYSFFYRSSGGKVKFAYQVLPEWVQLPFSASKYELGKWNGGDPNGYYNAAVRAADPFIDYSKFDVVYILSPTTIKWDQIAYGPAFPNRVETSDGILRNGTFSGADAYNNGPNAQWKWSSHETGHLFGLYDLYTLEPQPPTYGSWDLMANNWSEEALELNAWNRFTQGWLNPDQYACLDALNLAPQEFTLVPIGSESKGQKAVFVKLSDSKILVIESRRTAGFDKIKFSQEGMLVYTVDMTIESIKGGFNVQRREGSTDKYFTDAALRVGDSVIVDGIKVEIPLTDANKVKVSKP